MVVKVWKYWALFTRKFWALQHIGPYEATQNQMPL